MMGLTTVTNSCVFAAIVGIEDEDREQLEMIANYIDNHDYEHTAEWSNDGKDLNLWVYLTRKDMDIAELCDVIEGNENNEEDEW